MPPIRVYHSFRSPYSRLGLHVLARAGLEAELIPFTGPPEGNRFDDPAANPAKLAYYMLDVPRMTMRMRLPIMPPNPFEIDLAPSYKAAVAAERDGKGMAFALAVSDARWGEGKNVAEMSVLEDCADACGWRREAVAAAQADAGVTAAMAEHRKMITEDGVFGVPFAVMGASKYWGHDRFDMLAEDAKR
ncbi:MAG: DsbA family protein [Parvularculaceae bacterium]